MIFVGATPCFLENLRISFRAAHLATANSADGRSITKLEKLHNEWLLQCFLTDCENLTELYSELDLKSSWVDEARSSIDQI